MRGRLKTENRFRRPFRFQPGYGRNRHQPCRNSAKTAAIPRTPHHPPYSVLPKHFRYNRRRPVFSDGLHPPPIHTAMKIAPLLLLLLPFHAVSETVHVPAPVSFDRLPETPISPEPPSQPAPPAAVLLDDNGSTPEAQISRALTEQDWPRLTKLLQKYQTLPARDPVLHDYALGALRRAQLRHDEAVALYRGILAQQPDLAYPRFDLGVMLFENKQYREAAAELQRAKPDLQPDMQTLADRYLAAIKKEQSWQPEISLQYAATDNVNNASETEIIEWDGRQWRKTADSLPQSAHGIRYGLGVSRKINLGGRHFAVGRLNGDGVHYWDRHEYNEQSIHLAAGYKNRSVTRSFGILPFIEYNRLDGEPYNRVFGAQADFSGRLNDKWRIALNAGHIWKRYREERTAARYDGHMPSAGATLIYAALKNWLLFGGADWSHDITREAEQASVRKGVRLGVFKTFSDGLGLRANLHYSRRVFDAPGTRLPLRA